MSAASLHLTAGVGRLAAYIRRRLRDPDQTEDVVQETVMRVIEQERKKVIEHPLAYAFRVADSIIHADARKWPHLDLDDHADLMCDLPLADEVLDYRQRMDRFRTALEELTPLRRTVFVKRHLDGKSRQDIAQELGLSLEAVKKHLVRAMVDLSRAMEMDERPEGQRMKING